MTLSLVINTLVVAAGLLLVAAAVSDIRRFIIPNPIVLALVVLGVARTGLDAAAGAATWPLALPVLAALALLVAGAFAFQRGWLGGGDVKLLAAAALWMPAGRLFDFLTLVALLGGVLAVLVLVGARLLRPVPAGGTAGAPGAATRLPYGVAIAGGALPVLLDLAAF